MRCNFGQFGLLKSPLQMYDFVYDSAIVIQTAIIGKKKAFFIVSSVATFLLLLLQHHIEQYRVLYPRNIVFM
jgi:hypothetical protein